MNKNTQQRVWRSLLYMPADNSKFLEKAQGRGADAIILDLEDSVAPQNKGNARKLCSKAITELASGPADMLVRINAPLRHAIRDLEAVIKPGLNALFIPKVESAGVLRAIDDVVTTLELENQLIVGSIGLVPMIETPNALFSAKHIAEATKRNIGLILGSEDFAFAANLKPNSETLTPPKLQVALAAKAAGLMPIGVLDTVANFSDPKSMRETALRSADFGFEGATCIHPSMVEALNYGFSPRNEDLIEAHNIVKLMEISWKDNKGATQINGKMIDMPVYERAKALLGRAESIAKKIKNNKV